MDIYKITNIKTNKCYVGFSKNAVKRFQRHIALANKGINRRLYDSMRKHGVTNFILEIIDNCESREEALTLEKFWIEKLNTLVPNGYNMTVGGDGGNTLENWTEADRKELYARQALTRTGSKHTAETKAKISKAHIGKTMSEQQKKHLSNVLKEIGHRPPVIKGKIPWITGKIHSEEARKKMSDARLGKKWEDLWDNSYIEERKCKLRANFLGENNPRYINFTTKDKIQVLLKISNDITFQLKNSFSTTGFSEYKVRELLRFVGISSFQSAKKQQKLNWKEYIESLIPNLFYEGMDVTELLGIIKHEPEPEFRHADAKGTFPAFLRKSDQERIQNCFRDVQQDLQTKEWEVTEKLEGSSHTSYFYNGEFGVCSRNLELKESTDNTFWTVAIKYNLKEKLSNLGRNLMLQGEMVGPGIQGNIYDLDEHTLFIYDIFDIDKQEYLSPDERHGILMMLDIDSVPIIQAYYTDYANSTCDQMLGYADGKSVLNPKVLREGLVYKLHSDQRVSFKTVSNAYLISNP